eukprot:TRINITY_DN3251_c0_g1_i2.p3 TRINITY_DN3251_c0_g1~~TRINITY_DN3251_c0_g1_i2.p3  ORF type:complete len:127 (-),score=27.66 TRINITY_DN3251_c0_g1_i2:282-662(-)
MGKAWRENNRGYVRHNKREFDKEKERTKAANERRHGKEAEKRDRQAEDWQPRDHGAKPVTNVSANIAALIRRPAAAGERVVAPASSEAQVQGEGCAAGEAWHCLCCTFANPAEETVCSECEIVRCS